MQNDLISRSALIEAIVNRTGSPTVLFNTTEELNAYLDGCAFKQNHIIDIIEEQPTAYDVEKVMAELRERADDNLKCAERLKGVEPKTRISEWKGRAGGFKTTIRIIRNGEKE